MSTILPDLLRSLEAEPLVEHELAVAPRFALLVERISDPAWRKRVEATECSLDEADDPAFGSFQRGMHWVPPCERTPPA